MKISFIPRGKPEFTYFRVKLNVVYFALYTEHLNICVYTVQVDKRISIEEYNFVDENVFLMC